MEFDVVIIGGGLVGASLACALGNTDLQIALVESGLPAAPETTGWDSRIYAISPGNAEFLRESGAWQRMDMSRVQPVTDMRVFGDTGAELDFNSFEIGAAELTFILESRELQHALWHTLQQQENLTLFTQSRCRQLQKHDTHITLTLENERSLNTKLIVGADGRDSWVRKQAGMAASPVSYQQDGVVANFKTEKPHHGTAFQWFLPDGILALLPLPQQMVSMVWSASPEKSVQLMAMDTEELCKEVSAASHNMLGEMELVTAPAAFPLRLMRLDHVASERVVLIGDAAHNVHPLAGQGVNLGFRDARSLARILQERGPLQDCGDIRLLRRHERARKEDVLSMQLTTDTLKKLFNNTNPLLRTLRNSGLSLTSLISPLRKMLTLHALN